METEFSLYVVKDGECEVIQRFPTREKAESYKAGIMLGLLLNGDESRRVEIHETEKVERYTWVVLKQTVTENVCPWCGTDFVHEHEVYEHEKVCPDREEEDLNECRSDGRSCDCGWSWDGGENLDFPAPCPEGKSR